MEMDLSDMMLVLLMNIAALPISYAIFLRIRKHLAVKDILKKLHLTR